MERWNNMFGFTKFHIIFIGIELAEGQPPLFDKNPYQVVTSSRQVHYKGNDAHPVKRPS